MPAPDVDWAACPTITDDIERALPVHGPESPEPWLRALSPAARSRVLRRAAELERELPGADRDRALEIALIEREFAAAAPLTDEMEPEAQVTHDRVTPRAREAAPAAAPASAIETSAASADTPPRRAVDPTEHVRRFAALGARLLTLQRRGKRPHSSTWSAAGEPAALVERHVARGGNYAVLTGRGLAVLDVDAGAGGVESLARLECDLGLDLSGYPTVWTGSGGGSRHIYLAVPVAGRYRTTLREYPGLEFRAGGRGGAQYVVGPGSIHPSGEPYRWDPASLERIEAAELAGDPWLLPAPAALLDCYARQQAEPQAPDELEPLERLQAALDAIPTVDCRDYERWLSIGMALHAGSGGDPDALAAWIQWSARDPQYQHEAADTCREKWETFGGSGVGPGTLYALAKEYSGEVPPRPAPEVAFEALPSDSAERKPTYLSVADYARLVEPAPPVVDGLFYAAGTTVLHGREGTGKSYLALDLGFHIALGRDTWHGRPLHASGRVVYIAGEGQHSIPERLVAWATHHGVALEEVGDRFLLRRPGGVNLAAEQTRAKMRAELAELGPALVVIDTLSSVLVGADENAVKDISPFVTWCNAVARDTGALVLVIHHPAKGSGQARGSSALTGNADGVVRLVGHGHGQPFRLCVDKVRAGQPMRGLHLQLASVSLGPDPERPGREVVNAVVVPAVERARTIEALALELGESEGWPLPRKRLVEALGEHLGLKRRGAEKRIATELPADPQDAWERLSLVYLARTERADGRGETWEIRPTPEAPEGGDE